MNVTVVIVAIENKHWKKISSYLSMRYNVRITAYLREAYKILESESVSIIVMDYGILGEDTIGFLKKIRNIKPQTETIILSERPTLSTAIQTMNEGAYDFYELPVNMRLLKTIIDKAIEKQALFLEKTALEERVINLNTGNIIGKNRRLKSVLNIAQSIASKNVNILITGESGTGKDMLANVIHNNSSRASAPFIKVNCAVFNEGVLESELFGHEKGSFTGAVSKRIGRFELANTGTIFLDEIGDLPLNTQVKLLRVLQEKEFERVGGNETITVNVRVIAATNQDLKSLIEIKRFREDFYYRLNVVHIEMPSLRERKDDIPRLVNAMIKEFNEEKGCHIMGIKKAAMRILMDYQWPGNVRELKNAIESAMALCEGNIIDEKYLPSYLNRETHPNDDFYHIPKNLTLVETEREIIRLTLLETTGNKTHAAKLLGIGLRTLQRKAKELNL
ncbi:MAG: sigma-54-dependent Fis family transcriptional regulator [Nitrospirae bacterium]|nr:sigma-54-dependent Fis family transcriptional regulator [Nitrospirota bacterium]